MPISSPASAFSCEPRLPLSFFCPPSTLKIEPQLGGRTATCRAQMLLPNPEKNVTSPRIIAKFLCTRPSLYANNSDARHYQQNDTLSESHNTRPFSPQPDTVLTPCCSGFHERGLLMYRVDTFRLLSRLAPLLTHLMCECVMGTAIPTRRGENLITVGVPAIINALLPLAKCMCTLDIGRLRQPLRQSHR